MTTESVAPEMPHPWPIYLQASEEARRRGDRRAGTDHLLLALLEAPSTEVALGVSLQQARQALESLDHEAVGALGLGPGADAPPLPMRAVPKEPTIRAVIQTDRLRMTSTFAVQSPAAAHACWTCAISSGWGAYPRPDGK